MPFRELQFPGCSSTNGVLYFAPLDTNSNNISYSGTFEHKLLSSVTLKPWRGWGCMGAKWAQLWSSYCWPTVLWGFEILHASSITALWILLSPVTCTAQRFVQHNTMCHSATFDVVDLWPMTFELWHWTDTAQIALYLKGPLQYHEQLWIIEEVCTRAGPAEGQMPPRFGCYFGLCHLCDLNPWIQGTPGFQSRQILVQNSAKLGC